MCTVPLSCGDAAVTLLTLCMPVTCIVCVCAMICPYFKALLTNPCHVTTAFTGA